MTRMRMIALVTAMILVMVGVALAARPDGAPLWAPGGNGLEPVERASKEPSAAAETGLAVPGEKVAARASGISESNSSGTGGGTAATAGAADTRKPGADTARTPAESVEPPADPVAHLDKRFGEKLFPEITGMKLIGVFDVDDEELTATYKATSASAFDLVRVTVHRADSKKGATAVNAEVSRLFPDDRAEIMWGGRKIVLGSRSMGAAEESAWGFVWRQGRYAVDVMVSPPYVGGPAGAKTEALEFIGRLRY